MPSLCVFFCDGHAKLDAVIHGATPRADPTCWRNWIRVTRVSWLLNIFMYNEERLGWPWLARVSLWAPDDE